MGALDEPGKADQLASQQSCVPGKMTFYHNQADLVGLSIPSNS
jgi:hypothetical protein